ncbi:hypothetical protein L1887_59472 [Cichorium endivia]|nr:hypothetical protein L1887_59472 [Cichorium endivia]
MAAVALEKGGPGRDPSFPNNAQQRPTAPGLEAASRAKCELAYCRAHSSYSWHRTPPSSLAATATERDGADATVTLRQLRRRRPGCTPSHMFRQHGPQHQAQMHALIRLAIATESAAARGCESILSSEFRATDRLGWSAKRTLKIQKFAQFRSGGRCDAMRCDALRCRAPGLMGWGWMEAAVGTQLHRSSGAVSEAGLAQRQKSQHWLGSHARSNGRPAQQQQQQQHSAAPPPRSKPGSAQASLMHRCSDSLLVAAESAVSRARQHHSARSHAILMAASPPSSAQPRLGLHPFSIPPPPPPVLIHNISSFQHLLCIPRLASSRLASKVSPTPNDRGHSPCWHWHWHWHTSPSFDFCLALSSTARIETHRCFTTPLHRAAVPQPTSSRAPHALAPAVTDSCAPTTPLNRVQLRHPSLKSTGTSTASCACASGASHAWSPSPTAQLPIARSRVCIVNSFQPPSRTSVLALRASTLRGAFTILLALHAPRFKPLCSMPSLARP